MTQFTAEDNKGMVKNENMIKEKSGTTSGVKQARAKAAGKNKNGGKAKAQKKVKDVKSEDPDSEIDCTMRLTVKEEPDDADYVEGKRGKKRKRPKEEEEEADEGPSRSHKSDKKLLKKNKRAEEDGEATSEKKRRSVKSEEKMKKPKREPKRESKEQGENDKVKKTKEEREAARALKLKLKEEEEQQRWRWWEEERYKDGIKWRFLEHKGPFFPPEYQPLPADVHFYYNGKVMKLSPITEETALFFAQMLDHEYTIKEVFRSNFFKDWRKEMNVEERRVITDLNKCNFTELHTMHKNKVEARKNMTKEDKLVNKDANQKIVDEFGFCLLDHHKERIGNFKIEPPGLFRGRGEHPKMGMLKKRVQPEDVIINCSKGSHIPQPPAGHRWKEVRHDNTVTWLASWTENVQGSVKYIMLNANSKLKGEKDWEKYEVARQLKGRVDQIRTQYQEDLKSKQMVTRQRAVALYFIDKLALRAGNEKEEGEGADTVGCCSLRVEHITLHDALDGHACVVEFDFLGKDSIRYYNKVPVSKRAFKNLKLFLENKQPGDDLFDRLSTATLNKHLSSLMPGLTAKVFRTYNASITLQQQLKELSNMVDSAAEKLLSYNRANRAVAILCNHQRAPPKTFEQSMANLQSKIDTRKEQMAQAKLELKKAKKEAKGSKDPKLKAVLEKKQKAVMRVKEQLLRMEVQATDKEENKQIALGTSKLNYLDPRISVAWCKNMEVPLDKVYNKSQRDKFAWALDMTEKDFEF
ncbi:DNA topoisomerase I, mitochondrial isoform X2 [Clupea harengus]|uniref:DNA topoisomerase I n=1 Tax=Clupea harengus TaxID=7950 RepID=A0A6P3WGD2_CLUHA|nr:DNA topoisomerase I, mitochondrial isoform X2 [Clupea harengus]